MREGQINSRPENPNQLNQIELVLGDYENFVETLVEDAANAGIDVGAYGIDHVCYRVESQPEYEEMKQRLSNVSQSFTESQHNGRLISVFKLSHPFMVGDYSVDLIELPAPKPNHPYPSGLEHLEMVVGHEYDDLKLSRNWTSEDQHGEYNPTLSLKLESGVIKFHPLSLEEVILKEGKEFSEIHHSAI